MFIGHFAIGFAAKTAAPRVSLGTLFLAAQFIDLLWPTFLLMGLERVRIEPGATAVTPLVFEHYPYSHSLLAVLGWALLLGGLHFLLQRERRSALILAGLVLSHWLLDLLVHRPDLPMWPWGNTVAGLRLWSSLTLTLALEVPLFMLGVWLYSRSTRALDPAGRWGLVGLVLFLFVVYAGNVLGSPPPSVEVIAWLGQLQWLLVLWGYWVDRHRRALALN
ncbi:metal-dependent hydrolase [Rhodoferax sp. BAB1]|uniref:metal-dependent hydrolase n=1 Tax=Rhodoferax sp. BAB1 TaxID=2741720 RepID=UPI00157693F2|nr:metal-dependent hydrolase [Rhodoferax sp. BAB1]QKO21273.1 metal-dependent hydrolase [Rhodoferax sp. BAB1]